MDQIGVIPVAFRLIPCSAGLRGSRAGGCWVATAVEALDGPGRDGPGPDSEV